MREPDRYQGGPGRAFRSCGWVVGVAGLGRPRLAPRSQVDPAHSWWGTNPREPALSPLGQTRRSSSESGPPVPTAGLRDSAGSGPPVPAAGFRECALGPRPGEWALSPEGRALESGPQGVGPGSCGQPRWFGHGSQRTDSGLRSRGCICV